MLYHQWATYVHEFCAEILGLYSIQDYFEVFIFMLISYQTLHWLKQDHTKHLLLTTYTYFALLTISFYSSCTVLFTTGLLLAPAYIIFCIVIHQKQLQKNFVLASKKYFTPVTTPQKNWLETLMQCCLITSHHKKHITCIIECNDNLHELLHAPFTLQLPVQEDIANLLLASNNVNEHSICWVDQSGVIISINVAWSNFLKNEILITPANNVKALTYAAATLLTQKTDAIVFDISTTSDLHTIWYQGKCMKQLTISQLLTFTKSVLYQTNKPSQNLKKGATRDQNHPIA